MLSKHKLFFDINSKDRISGTDGHFSYHLDIPDDKNYDHVCLVGATIPKSYYLIPADGNTFTLREENVDAKISLPVGNCSRRSFRAVVEDLLNKHSPKGWVYTVTYPKSTEFDTGKFTYTCSMPNRSVLIMPQRKTSHLYEQFGFDPGSLNIFAGGTLESTNVTKFVVHDSIFVRSDICRNGKNNVLHGIDAVSTEPFSDISHHCPEMAAYSKPLTSSTGSIYQFSVTDENGKVLDFNGLPVILRIVIYQSDNLNELLKQAVGLYDAQVNST